MVFPDIALIDQKKIDSTASDCGTIQTYCGYFLDELSKFFGLSHIQANMHVSFNVQEGLECRVFTPYGTARGRLDIHLVDGQACGRYVFEKCVVAEDGSDTWKQIWAVRISRYGNVMLGDEGDKEISVTDRSPHNNAISAPAKSLLFCIANTPIFSK